MLTTEEKKMLSSQEHYQSTLMNLRAKNFGNDLPFLLLSEKLPEGQVYREFADGRIELQEVFFTGSEYKSKLIEILSPMQAALLRKEHGLQ